MDELETFSFSIEQTFKEGVGVSVYIMLLKHSEARVLHYRVFKRTDFKFMSAVEKRTVSVDPGQEGGDIGQFGEGDNGLIEFYLAAADELALENTVVDLLMEDLLTT